MRRGESYDGLHSIELMRAILDRERMRSDRFQSSFALLTLSFSSSMNGESAGLGRILRKRIRATDEAGFLSPRRVGLVLPETPASGAWKLADDICHLLPANMQQPECDVYVYPSDRDQGDVAEHSEVDDRRGRAGARPMEVLFVQALPAWKRTIDVVGASAALVILSPVLLLVALAIKLTSSGPIIFMQRRDTIGGRQFTIYKFRTMTADAERTKAALLQQSEQDGPAFKMKHDPRVTRIGRLLRSTSIDELPQLFNVLKGDMTLVGPRAMDSNESRCCEAWQRRRLDVTAGITCIWQVRGRSVVPFVEWMRMDLRYIHTRSMANDLKLILQTVPAVVIGRGAH
jgi:lipopolysaccharide/colanic/teichoic acid biosynthesis glycosyltransferase